MFIFSKANLLKKSHIDKWEENYKLRTLGKDFLHYPFITKEKISNSIKAVRNTRH